MGTGSGRRERNRRTGVAVVHDRALDRAHLCAGTHDHTKSDFPLLRPPILIGDQSWVCADAFVGPGVTIGEGAIVGAGAVVTKDLAPWMIAVGNPARAIKRRAVTE